MSDYKETFIDQEIPAYHVSCRYCGVDLYGRSGEHKPDCPRHAPKAVVDPGDDSQEAVA